MAYRRSFRRGGMRRRGMSFGRGMRRRRYRSYRLSRGGIRL